MKILARSSNKDYSSYNKQQTEVGHPLYTLKGSRIGRSSKYGVGKEIGGDIYVHKSYADQVVPREILRRASEVIEHNFPEFTYNTIRYSPKTGVVSFQECPDFDSAREPKVGDYINVSPEGSTKKGHSEYIFHHKWLWVKNNYRGFDVRKSWEWSKKWLSVLQEPSDGNGIQRWNNQLDRHGLEHDEEDVEMKRVVASTEERSPTMFYKLTVEDVLPVLQEDKDNLILCHQLEQEGWDAIRVEHHLFGSEVVGEFLYLCVPGRDDVEINGRLLDPDEILDVIPVDDLPEDMVSETCEPGIIRGFISNYELNPPVLNDVALELLEEGYDFIDILRAARDIYTDLDL